MPVFRPILKHLPHRSRGLAFIPRRDHASSLRNPALERRPSWSQENPHWRNVPGSRSRQFLRSSRARGGCARLARRLFPGTLMPASAPTGSWRPQRFVDGLKEQRRPTEYARPQRQVRCVMVAAPPKVRPWRGRLGWKPLPTSSRRCRPRAGGLLNCDLAHIAVQFEAAATWKLGPSCPGLRGLDLRPLHCTLRHWPSSRMFLFANAAGTDECLDSAAASPATHPTSSKLPP